MQHPAALAPHHFLGAVIDARSFNKLKEVIDRANAEANVDVIIGGTLSAAGEALHTLPPTVARPRT